MELFNWRTTMRSELVEKEMVDEGRATHLLGLPKQQLREICEMSGLGHWEEDETTLELFFTYEELYRLCRLLVGPTS